MNEVEALDKLDRRRLRYRLQHNSQITKQRVDALARVNSASRILHKHCQTLRLIVRRRALCNLAVNELLNPHSRVADLKQSDSKLRRCVESLEICELLDRPIRLIGRLLNHA